MHTLLVVDDDPDVLSTLTRSFRKGYKTLAAPGGAEGIAILNGQPVDLIICDQRMPGIGGVEVLNHAVEVQPDAIRILLTGYTDVDSLLACVNDAHIYKYVTKPWDPAELNLTVVRALESLDLKRDLDAARGLLESAYQDAVVMLCLAAEGKDQDTSSHLYRVQNYTEALAIAMGVDEKEAAHMGLMSMLHDIGKLATPDSILKKPGKLTDEEWVIMREHPLAGVRILGSNPFYELAREISAGHHENFDGTGYPNKLRGEAIPLSARIVKLADVFDALTTKRPYKEPWSMEAALENIESFSGSMFDPSIVKQFKQLYFDGTLDRIKNAH
ncbi:MAG: response regulator [Methylococcales bacterium]|nr:response regulator [Methylococcales bacterium]